MRFFPSRHLLLMLVGLVILALLTSVFSLPAIIWKVVSISIFVLMVLDLVLVFRPHGLAIERNMASSFPLNVKREIQLTFSNQGHYKWHFHAFDHYPEHVLTEGLPVELSLEMGESISSTYQIKAVQRGLIKFSGCQIHLNSPYRLWIRNIWLPVESEVRVYPDFAAVSHYALMATDHQLSQLGILKRRRRGEGQDFHQLREYRQGDALRQIDWKASSRMRKIISREYQDERDQEIIILLDCGHRMMAKDDHLSHFDHTLNAMLLLGYVALKQGDAVGIGTFGGANRWMKPGKGIHYLQTLLNGVYDLQPTTDSPDYIQVASELLVKHKKRALVVLITNLRDEDADELLPALNVLKRRHLVVLASMRESILEDSSTQNINRFDDAIVTTGIHHYLQYRQKVFEKVMADGILSIDTLPQDLSVDLVNQYMSIKSSGML